MCYLHGLILMPTHSQSMQAQINDIPVIYEYLHVLSHSQLSQIQTEHTHIFSHTLGIWGARRPSTHVQSNIQTIVSAVPWDNCACLCPAVLLLTLNNTETKCPFQCELGRGGVQPSSPKCQTKVGPCCSG